MTELRINSSPTALPTFSVPLVSNWAWGNCALIWASTWLLVSIGLLLMAAGLLFMAAGARMTMPVFLVQNFVVVPVRPTVDRVMLPIVASSRFMAWVTLLPVHDALAIAGVLVKIGAIVNAVLVPVESPEKCRTRGKS